VRSHRDHVGRLLREAGWSRQHPIERATQRNEAAIRQWDEERWPQIKKKPSRSRPPSTGRDEAGFSLLPMAVRTWAPCGQTPVLRVPLSRDHLAAISGITLAGRLFLQVRPASYDASAVVGFLRVLLRKLSGKIIVIWDGSPIHRGHEIKDLLARGATKRLHLEQLPGYAPDLNPDEGIWKYREASSSWAMSVVRTWITCINSSSGPENACGTNATSFAVVRKNVATWCIDPVRDR
jgi:DDE superfamily endonuclease/Winged helix-turn helix